jgi:hypothetical protein
VLIGSGVTEENMKRYELASGFIVGSYFKDDGKWENPISRAHVQNFMKSYRKIWDGSSS